MNRDIARVVGMKLSPQGRSVRISFQRNGFSRIETCALHPDEIVCRDIRIGDHVVLGRKSSGRATVYRPLLEMRNLDSKPFKPAR